MDSKIYRPSYSEGTDFDSPNGSVHAALMATNDPGELYHLNAGTNVTAANLPTHLIQPPSPDTALAHGSVFWGKYCRPVLASLLEDVGSYTRDEQASHLRFLEKHIIPNLGPSPDPARPISLLAANGSPFETSINISDAGKPCLRFIFDPVMPESNNWEESCIHGIATEVGADMTWFRQLAAELFPTAEERAVIRQKMPEGTSRIPRCFLAFDLDGGNRTMKAYFSPLMKNMATGINSDLAAVNLLKRLQPCGSGLVQALEFIEEYRSFATDEPLISVLAIDCVRPELARVKIYTTPPSNTFTAIRDYVTFGGRRKDDTTLRGLGVLRNIWHLLLAEPEEVSDDFSKRVRDDKSGHQGVCCSWEIRVGQTWPDVKVYIPLFQYFTNDLEVAEAMQKVFNRQGWEWGKDGEYLETLGNAFGSEVVSGKNRDKLVHTYLSFNFSQKKGSYITTYLAPLVRIPGASS